MTSSLSRHLASYNSIFVSCSSLEVQEVRKFIDELKASATDITINYSFHGQAEGEHDEVSELQLCYEAVEASQCVVSFLSQDYFTSRVCLEEYSIALAKQLSDNAFYLLPIHTGAVEEIPRSLSSLPSVDASGGESQLVVLAEIVEQILLNSTNAGNQEPNVKALGDKFEEKRASEFTDKFRLDGGNITWNTSLSNLDYGLKGRAAFLCAPDCLTFAAILLAILKQHASGLCSEIIQCSDKSQPGHQLYPSTADIVVIFLSDQLASSPTLKTNLLALLCRLQSGQDCPAIYFIQSQHQVSCPLFLHILPIPVCLDDKIWKRLQRACSNRNPRYTVNLDNVQGLFRCTGAQNLALSAAAFDVIHVLCHRTTSSIIPTNVINLAKQDNEMKGLNDDNISVHEYIISLDSLNRMVSQRRACLQGRMPTVSTSSPSPSSLKTDSDKRNSPALCSTNLELDIIEELPSSTLGETSNLFAEGEVPVFAGGKLKEKVYNKYRSETDYSHFNIDKQQIIGLDAAHQYDFCDESDTDAFSSSTSMTSVATTSSIVAQSRVSVSHTLDNKYNNPSPSPGSKNRGSSILCQII